MTIRDMFNKVNLYNKLTEELNLDTDIKTMYVIIDDSNEILVKSMKEFKKCLNERYVKELVKAVIEYDKFEFDSVVHLNIKQWFGYREIENEVTIEVTVY